MTNKLRQIRTTNTTKVIDVLRERGGRTVRDIAGDTQLSRATVSKILSSLQAQAIVVDRGMGSSTPEGGKPPKLYSFDPAARFLIGMHLFHNDIVAGIVD
ncbi:MAG: winged helix-turn-helix domain-containing protein, partial [Spirochaetales bacterium]|nr:winged helix-turn-helix domain-containing protein [Spirochaetales bacterium]